jgi:hypothetical protein
VPEGVEARIYREPGYLFAPLRRGSDRAGAVFTTAESRDAAIELAQRAANGICFHVERLDPASVQRA